MEILCIMHATPHDLQPMSTAEQTQEALAGFMIDDAFKRACHHLGVTPDNLKGSTLADFRAPDVPDAVAEKRLAADQERRLRLLVLVASERKRIIRTVMSKAPESQQPEATTDADLNAMEAAARRQRQIWDTELERQRLARERRTAERETYIQKSVEFSESARQQAETENRRKEELQRYNQDMARRRLERDERNERIRREREEADLEMKTLLAQNHIEEVRSARQRRVAKLEEVMKKDSDKNTEGRLKHAHELRKSADSSIAEKAKQQLEAAERRREELIIAKFLDHVALANRAVHERKKVEATMLSATERRKARLHELQRKIQQQEEKSRQLQQQKFEDDERKRSEAVASLHDHVNGAFRRRQAQLDAKVHAEQRKRELSESRDARLQAERHAAEQLLQAELEDTELRRVQLRERVARSEAAQQARLMEEFQHRQGRASARREKLDRIRTVAMTRSPSSSR